jgi:hypothetical protein
MDTARPALSSAGEVILEPEDKRERDLLNSELDWLNSCALVCADMFVFITILTPSLSHPLWGFVFTRHPCREQAFLKAPAIIPSSCLRPPGAVFQQLCIDPLSRHLSVEILRKSGVSGLAFTTSERTAKHQEFVLSSLKNKMGPNNR